ncbi:P-loop NTPase fold protein [Sphingomonas hylomeconis]|uniref:P-loop NTPase fold protein n=1 Tax=Sphingomonas hylomeconis TaxID=1395958 RepID=A0ABV7ST29_9SPHN|nr:P-loop NTPase fold protein [Sphingomonas hylomeconis]
MIGIPLDANPSTILKNIADHLRDAAIYSPEVALDALRLEVPNRESARIRWDAVELLGEAAKLRDRTMVGKGSIDYSHLIAGVASSTLGNLALQDVLPVGTLEPLRRATLSILRDVAHRRGAEPAWLGEIARIEATTIVQGDRRAGYSSDRVAVGGDVFGTSADAKALADVIMLEAAAPPLAVGIFGAWGSGKSTLIAELKREIARQVQTERQRSGIEQSEPGLARVSGVMQLEFNAWSFADSENLWASLTAELFDQIAAGGSERTSAAIGTRLVSEVAALTGREASELTIAKMQLHESEGAIAEARLAVSEAKQKEHVGLVLAVTDAFAEMMGDKKSSKKSGGDDDVGQDSDGADANKPAGKAEKDKIAIDAVREALLVDAASGGVLAKKYAEAGTPMAEFLLFAGTWVRSKVARRAFVILAAVVAAVALMVILLVRNWPTVTGLVGAPLGYVSATVLAIAPFAYLTLSIAAPMLRGASLIRRKFVEARDRNVGSLTNAEKKLRAGENAKREAEASINRSEAIVKQYSGIGDAGSPPPALMLKYLLKDSADLASLRGRLGTLGTVRRCFEQLNHILERMNSGDKLSEIQRIVIYIDDLDRCSERQVVQILEAIHLMLAFPCFVVVAAVDVRWLRSALTTEHRAMSDGEFSIDPADYLEKIFQIPFWVRTMTPGETESAGYVKYLHTLLQTKAAADASDATQERENPDVGGGAQGAFPSLEPKRPSLADPHAGMRRQLMLTGKEIGLLEAMHPVAARSPRAVKRMINIYRLIRVSIPEHLVGDYLGAGSEVPPYWAVILLLACETGLPTKDMGGLATNIRALAEGDLEGLIAFNRGIYDEPELRELTSSTEAVLDIANSRGGLALRMGLTALEEREIDADHGALVRALDTIGRYSFRIEC